jgi:hypothetical protein
MTRHKNVDTKESRAQGTMSGNVWRQRQWDTVKVVKDGMRTRVTQISENGRRSAPCRGPRRGVVEATDNCREICSFRGNVCRKTKGDPARIDRWHKGRGCSLYAGGPQAVCKWMGDGPTVPIATGSDEGGGAKDRVKSERERESERGKVLRLEPWRQHQDHRYNWIIVQSHPRRRVDAWHCLFLPSKLTSQLALLLSSYLHRTILSSPPQTWTSKVDPSDDGLYDGILSFFCPLS